MFDLKNLQNFRIGNYDPLPELEKKIPDPRIVNLIMSMIRRDPRERPTIQECLQMWSQEVFPKSFSHILFPLNSSFVRPHYLFSDLRISLVRKYMPSIFKCCFDISYSTA